jgi:hypothetical protein
MHRVPSPSEGASASPNIPSVPLTQPDNPSSQGPPINEVPAHPEERDCVLVAGVLACVTRAVR